MSYEIIIPGRLLGIYKKNRVSVLRQPSTYFKYISFSFSAWNTLQSLHFPVPLFTLSLTFFLPIGVRNVQSGNTTLYMVSDCCGCFSETGSSMHHLSLDWLFFFFFQPQRGRSREGCVKAKERNAGKRRKRKREKRRKIIQWRYPQDPNPPSVPYATGPATHPRGLVILEFLHQLLDLKGMLPDF